jgi:hypothetical protein
MVVIAQILYDNLKNKEINLQSKTMIVENFIDHIEKAAAKLDEEKYLNCISENTNEIKLLMEKKAPWHELMKACNLISECIILKDKSIIDNDFPAPSNNYDFIRSLSDSHSKILLNQVESDFFKSLYELPLAQY